MTAAATVTIPTACNGPLDSGQGGYSAGALARHVAADAVAVRLRRPVPLGTPLAVVAPEGEGARASGRDRGGEGAGESGRGLDDEGAGESGRGLGGEGAGESGRDRGDEGAGESGRGLGGRDAGLGRDLLDGDGALVAEGRPADPGDLALDPPAPVSVADARAAMDRYRGPTSGPLCRCYVCGRLRADALGVFAGPVAGRDGVVASTWTPPAWTAGADGRVHAEHVWAALDCPTYFAAYGDAPDPLPLAVLGRFVARLDAPVAAGAEHVVVAWPLGVDGRKRDAAAAILSPAGEPLALARALLIEPRTAPG